ncbi:MAG: cyclase family protein [Deferribacterales bacterium]|jgi:kynurenine formamidase
MKMIDLTHMIQENMPVYPGTKPPEIKVETTIGKNGFEERLITMFSHTGTHMDTPCHIMEGGRSLSDYDISDFTGRGVLIDVRGMEIVSLSYIKSYEAELKGADFAVLMSGWSKRWGDDRYFTNYPVLSEEASLFLAKSGLKGICVDMISVDPVDTVDFGNHKIFFGHEMLIVENLANLDKLEGKEFAISCLPLNIERGDGSPVRAFAIIS